MTSRRRRSGSIAVLAAALGVALVGSARTAAQDVGTEAQRESGKKLYAKYCAQCHGDKGDGKSRAAGSLSTMPRDFTSADSKRELSRERIVAAITFGRPGTAMVAWKSQLSETDIARLADYVYRHFVQGGPAPAASATVSGTHAHGGRQADAARGTVHQQHFALLELRAMNQRVVGGLGGDPEARTLGVRPVVGQVHQRSVGRQAHILGEGTRLHAENHTVAGLPRLHVGANGVDRPRPFHAGHEG